MFRYFLWKFETLVEFEHILKLDDVLVTLSKSFNIPHYKNKNKYLQSNQDML